jgi:hypothetical protein
MNITYHVPSPPHRNLIKQVLCRLQDMRCTLVLVDACVIPVGEDAAVLEGLREEVSEPEGFGGGMGPGAEWLAAETVYGDYAYVS